MELPQLVVELVGDYSKLLEDIKKARVEAVKQAQFLEKDLNLNIGVNDDSLKRLNQHFDLKVTHFKQTQAFFKNNPLKVYVDDRELTNLNKELDKLSQRKVTANVNVNNGRGNKNNSVGDVVKNVIMSPVNLAANIAMLPFKAVGKIADSIGKGIDNIAVGFTEEIGRTLSIKLTGKSTKQFAKKIQDGFRLVDEEIIGKSQVYETFFAELFRSGQIDKAFDAAKKRTNLNKYIERIGDLQEIAQIPATKRKSQISALDKLLKKDGEIRSQYESFAVDYRKEKPKARDIEVKGAFLPYMFENSQPRDLSNKIILPIIKEFQPLLNFIQGMQSYNTNFLSQKYYQERKPSFPILGSGENVVSVIGGAESKGGHGGRALATSLEFLMPNSRLMPVENPDTDATKRTESVDKWIKKILSKIAPEILAMGETPINTARQVAFSLNPLGSDVAAAQAIANTRLAQEQGKTGAALSFSLGGASAFRYAKTAEYAGLNNTNTLAMAYPFLNLADSNPQNFNAAIINHDPLTAPLKMGLAKPNKNLSILEDSGITTPGAEVHGVHHLFNSPKFLELLSSTTGESLNDSNLTGKQMSSGQQIGMELQTILIAAKNTSELLKSGQFSVKSFSELTTGLKTVSKLQGDDMDDNSKQIGREVEAYITPLIDGVIALTKEIENPNAPSGFGISLPKDRADIAGYVRYAEEIGKINNSLRAFKTGKPQENAQFSGDLDVSNVASEHKTLLEGTIPWFSKQEQFGSYGKELIKIFYELALVQEEFVKSGGKLSAKTLDSIKPYPLHEDALLLNKKSVPIEGEQSVKFPSKYHEENIRLDAIDAPDSMKKYPATILAFNKMVKSLGVMMPDASEIKAVAFGMSGASALLTDKLVYKTDLSPEGAQKIASKQELDSYNKLQGRLSPLLYAAKPGEALVTERVKGQSLKDILEELVKPTKELQEELKKESKEFAPLIKDLKEQLRKEKDPEKKKDLKEQLAKFSDKKKSLGKRIAEEKKKFNEIAEQLYFYVGQLGGAMQEMGVAHNDLASSNVFFDGLKIDYVTNKVDPGKISSIDLGNSIANPNRQQEQDDRSIAFQRAIVDKSYYGILNPIKTYNAINKGYKSPLPIPEVRQIDPKLLTPQSPATQIPIGYSGRSMLQEITGALPQLPRTILPNQKYVRVPVYRADVEVSESVTNAVNTSKELAAKFNASFVKLKSLLKDAEKTGNFTSVIEFSRTVKELGEKAKADIAKLRDSAGIDPNFAKSRESSQLNNSLSQITAVQNKAAIIANKNSSKAQGVDIGENIGAGVSEGLKNSIKDLRDTAEKLADIVPDVVTKKLKIESPSKVTMEYGENTGDGYGIGLEKSLVGVKTNATKLIDGITDTVEKQSVRDNPNLFTGNSLNPEIKKILDFAIKPDAEINKILGQPEITALDKLQDKSLIHKKLLEKINSLLPKGLESQFGINLSNSQLLGSGSFSSVIGTTDSRNLSYKVLEGKSIPTPIRMKINDGILTEPPEVSILKKLSSTGIVPAFNLFENNLLITEQITGKTFKQIISTITRMNISQEAYVGVIKTLYEASGSLLKMLHQYDITHGDFNNGNILVDTKGYLKAIDFQFGKDKRSASDKQYDYGAAGTFIFDTQLRAIEELEKRKNLDQGNLANFSLRESFEKGYTRFTAPPLLSSQNFLVSNVARNTVRPTPIAPAKTIDITPISTVKPVEKEAQRKSTKEQLTVPIQQTNKKPNIPESQQKMMDEFNKKLAALQGSGQNVGKGITKGLDDSQKNVKSSSEKLANTVINTVEEKLEIKSPSRWGIRVGKYVGQGIVKGLEFLEGGDNGIIPSLIRQINRIKESVENGTITSDIEKDKERLSRGFSKGLGSIPKFKEIKERFDGYKDFLKEIANPNVSAALGENLANGIVAAKELFVDFLKMPAKIKEGFNQAKVAFDSFIQGMNKVQKFGEIMDFLKSSVGNVVKVLGLLVVGKIILDLAPASIEVAANFENLERRIKFTSGSISEGAKNVAFLRAEAKRLNVDLSQTLESGSKFFQATKDTPIEGYQSRQIVSAVTQASAVYGLDLDKQQRTFTALEQMSGKTVVSQEELRQQLAEAIPNASQIAANAYGTTTQSMNQLLSTGRVLAEDFLPKFAQQLKAQTSSGVGDAVNSSVAITNRFNNSLIELQESIGKTLLPFRNFSLSAFASGIDLVTKNFQLLQSVLLITLIKLGSPVWLMFATYLKEISFSAGGAKGALLGMGQSIATLASQMFVLSMAMQKIDEIMMNFKDNSGAIGEQTRNVTQSINEQRKLLNPSSKVNSDDFSAFRERFTLNPFDNDTKKLKKQMEDSAKRTLEGRENTKNLLADSNSPAINTAIQEIQAIDKALDNIKMKRRAVIASDPGDIQTLRELQNQEKELSQRREKPLELFGGNKANLDKQVETLKTYLEYWEELKKNPKLYQSEIDDINKIIKVTKEDLATVTKEQDKMTKAIKNSLTEMQKFAIEIRNLEAKFNDLRSARDKTLSLEKANLFNLGDRGGILPGQVEYTNNLKTQENLIGKIADNLKQIQEMSAQLEINGLDSVLTNVGLNKNSGTDAIRTAQERAIDGSKEKEILTNYVKVREMQTQTIDMQTQLSEQKYNLTQSLYQQTKQVADYYRAAVRESQAVGIEFEKAQKTLENSKVQNKLRAALIGAGDNIYTQFVEGIINLISQTSDIQKQQLESKKQRIDYDNNVQDIKLQAAELQRSLPGKIIPLDSSVADNFNLSLKNVNNAVNEINKNIKDVANGLSKDVVDAAKKADASIKDLDGSSSSWLEGFGSKFARLVNIFKNGFDGIGGKINDLQVQTATWLGSLGNAPTMLGSAINVVEGAKSAVTGIFRKEAGQQLEQNVKSAVSNPLEFLKKAYGWKVGFVENSKSSADSSGGHMGDDIFAPIGSKVFSPASGTVVQSRVGGTRNTDDANPLVPGYQPQQLVIIKLDMPIEFEGKRITHLNMRHLLDRNVAVGQKVKMGDLLGTIGEAGGRGTQFGTKKPGIPSDADASHLHIEYAPAENDQRNSLPDAQASRLTAKLSQMYVANIQKAQPTQTTKPVVKPVTSSEIQDLQNAVNNFSQTKQKQRDYKDERNPWQRFTNWLMPSAGASEMPQQKTNTGVNFRKTSDAYKLNIDPKKTRLEFSKGWDQESKAYKDNNALGYFTAPMFNSWMGTERGKVVPVADLKFQDSVFRTKNRSAAKQRAFVNIDKQGKTRFGYGELTQDLEKQSDIFIGGLHVLYNNTEKQPAGYKGAYNTPGKQSAVLKTSRIRLIYGLNKDGSLSIVQSRKNLSIDEAKKLALKNGFNAAYLPDHGSKSRVIVPGVQAFDSTMRGEVGGYDSPTPYLIKVTSKPAVKPTAKPKVTSKPVENAFVSEPEPEKSGWEKFTNNAKKLVSNFSSQLPEFKLPNLDVPSFDLMGSAYAKPIAPRKRQVPPTDPRKLGLPSIQGNSFSENAQNLINTQLKPNPNQYTFQKNPNPRPIPISPTVEKPLVNRFTKPTSQVVIEFAAPSPQKITTKPPVAKPVQQTQTKPKQSGGVLWGKAVNYAPSNLSGLTSRGKKAMDALQNKNVRAFLDAVAVAEIGEKGADQGGYGYLIGDDIKGKESFDPNKLGSHPGKRVRYGKGKNQVSSATGRYQTMDFVAKEEFGRLGLRDFKPQSQEILAVSRMMYRGILDDVKKGNFGSVITRKGNMDASSEWASLAGNPYGQGTVGGKKDVFFRNIQRNLQLLNSAAMQGKSISPDDQQKLLTQATKLKLNTAAQQYEINRTNSNLSPEQIKENELKQRLEAYRLIMSSQKSAFGDISSTKDSTLGTRRTVLEGLSPNMSNAGRFSLQLNDLRRKLEKDVESLEQIIRETDGAIAQKPDLQAAFNLAMKKFPKDPKLAAEALQTNDLSFKATAFKNAEAKNNLAFLKSNINSILKASLEDFDKKEFFRLSEQDIQQQTKVIEQLQQQLQLVQKLEETDPLNPLVLSIPSLQKNISLLELNRDQYQQLLDLQKRYYEGGGKGGNMSEEAFQKEFKAILSVNSVKKEGVALNFNYADTVRRIKYATDELTKAQTIQASSIKLLQLDNERFAIDNKDGMVSLVSLTNELTIKTNELTNAYKKQLLEIQGNTLLSPQEKLTERLNAFRNYRKERSNLDAENSYQTKLAPITNRGIELGRMEKLNSSENAISSEKIRRQGLFGIRDRELQKAQMLSQIKMDFEKEKIEIAKLGLSSNYSAEEIQKLTDNLNALNELKLENVTKEFNMFTEAISGVKGDMDGIFKDFFMNTKSFGESISSVFQSILNNLANMASKELSNQLFTSVLGGGNKNSGGGIFSLLGGLFGGGGFSPGAFDFSSGFDFGGGLDFGSATLPSFAKGGMVGDLINKERAVSGFNPRLIIANEGERVLTPAETKIWNQMQASNNLQSFSSGGMVGQGVGTLNNINRGGDTINITPNVNINNEGSGGVNKAQFEKVLEAKIQETIKQERRPGGSLNRGGLYDR